MKRQFVDPEKKDLAPRIHEVFKKFYASQKHPDINLKEIEFELNALLQDLQDLPIKDFSLLLKYLDGLCLDNGQTIPHDKTLTPVLNDFLLFAVNYFRVNLAKKNIQTWFKQSQNKDFPITQLNNYIGNLSCMFYQIGKICDNLIKKEKFHFKAVFYSVFISSLIEQLIWMMEHIKLGGHEKFKFIYYISLVISGVGSLAFNNLLLIKGEETINMGLLNALLKKASNLIDEWVVSDAIKQIDISPTLFNFTDKIFSGLGFLSCNPALQDKLIDIDGKIINNILDKFINFGKFDSNKKTKVIQKNTIIVNGIQRFRRFVNEENKIILTTYIQKINAKNPSQPVSIVREEEIEEGEIVENNSQSTKNKAPIVLKTLPPVSVTHNQKKSTDEIIHGSSASENQSIDGNDIYSEPPKTPHSGRLTPLSDSEISSEDKLPLVAKPKIVLKVPKNFPTEPKPLPHVKLNIPPAGMFNRVQNASSAVKKAPKSRSTYDSIGYKTPREKIIATPTQTTVKKSPYPVAAGTNTPRKETTKEVVKKTPRNNKPLSTNTLFKSASTGQLIEQSSAKNKVRKKKL